MFSYDFRFVFRPYDLFVIFYCTANSNINMAFIILYLQEDNKLLYNHSRPVSTLASLDRKLGKLEMTMDFFTSKLGKLACIIDYRIFLKFLQK